MQRSLKKKKKKEPSAFSYIYIYGFFFLKSAAESAVRNISICICCQEIKRNRFRRATRCIYSFRLRLQSNINFYCSFWSAESRWNVSAPFFWGRAQNIIGQTVYLFQRCNFVHSCTWKKKKLLPQDLIFLILLGKPQEGRFKMIKEDKNWNSSKFWSDY